MKKSTLLLTVIVCVCFVCSLSSTVFAAPIELNRESASKTELIELYMAEMTSEERAGFLSRISSAENGDVTLENGTILISYQRIDNFPVTQASGVREYTITDTVEAFNIYSHSKTLFTLTTVFLETNNGTRVEVKSHNAYYTNYAGFDPIVERNPTETITSPVTSGSAKVVRRFEGVCSGGVGNYVLVCTSNPV